VLRRTRGSHHVFKKDGKTVVLPHPKKDLGTDLKEHLVALVAAPLAAHAAE
jgi:predicted RNA binding protein YcfA (HicA-like mRNA interferase family)